ncbi:hypothetical protein BGZ49_005246 [Haplosporangium sp. Z 27]|nr:hypothetical protein BGZ49_005246 [Haplosporangium sp. Z 27]
MGILSSILKVRQHTVNLIPTPTPTVTKDPRTASADNHDDLLSNNNDSNDVANAQDNGNSITKNFERPADTDLQDCLANSLAAELDTKLTSLSSGSSSSTCSSTMTLASPTFTFGQPTSEPSSIKQITEVVVCNDNNNNNNNSTSLTARLLRSIQVRPSKRRQEIDPVPDIEATVMAMEIDKDTSKPDATHEPAVTGGHELVKNDPQEQKHPLVQNRMFDIPEIIRSIAEFLDKPSLAASCRVSRIWAKHCAPLLWNHVVDKHWRDGRFLTSAKSKALYIRSMKCEDRTEYDELLLWDLPRLRALSFHGDRESMVVKDKILTKVSTTLTSLVLSSVADTLSTDTVVALCNLKQLTTLKLQNVSLQRKQLAEVLSSCECLEFLSLSRVRLTLGSSMNDDDDLDDTSDTSIVGTGQSARVTRIRYLALKEISAPVAYITMLIRSCPQLLELSLARNERMMVTKNLIEVMTASCPNLYALDIGSCKQIDDEKFSVLFTSITHLRVINLSGTKIGDEQLLLLAENCNSITRLDIQYCTPITSSGLHKFLTRCGPSLRHLEASGVTIEPETFDQNHWTCTNLEILFVHIGLVGTFIPYKSPIPVASQAGNNSESNSSSVNASSDGSSNEKKRPQDAISTSYSSSGEASNSTSWKSTNQDTAEQSTKTNSDTDGDIVMKHPLHPIQEVSNVQYLGLMGCGPRLTCSTQNLLIRGFRSVKRLHVLGLYQAFKKEDLEWLIENLPELCRIDAEKYNVSDELLKWFEETYPRVQICRQE